MPATVSRPSRPAGHRWAACFAGILAIAFGCGREPAPTEPDLAKGGSAAPLTVTPATLSFAIPPAVPATITAKVQFVGLITASTSDPGCAIVTPASLPATKPPGSPVYVATFTVKPVAVGSCTITLTDKKGGTATVQVTVSARVIHDRIVFASVGDLRRGIFHMKGDGSDLKRVTDVGSNPVLSPDGKRVAFDRFSAVTEFSNIYIVDIDGQNEHSLTSNPGGDHGSDVAPRFSPDGSKIVFWSHETGHHIWIMDADGQNKKDLTAVTGTPSSVGFPTLSPDGSKIAFPSGNADGQGIWVMNSDGTAPTRLTNSGTWLSDDLAWSPDGQSILFTGRREAGQVTGIFRVNADGTGETRLTTGTEAERSPAWSPDGTRIVFQRNGELYSRKLDGSEEVNLTQDPAFDGEPDWK